MKVNHSRKLGGRLAWAIWLLATLFSIYKFVSQTSYASLNAGIARAFVLDLGQIGELGALYTYAFAVMTIPSGALLDRYGARKILTVAAGIVALGAFIFSTAATWTALVLGQILMGLGGAFGFPGAGYFTRHWFPNTHFGVSKDR